MICPFCSPYTLPLQLPPLSWKMGKKHCLLCELRWKNSESVNDIFNSSRGGQWWFWMQYNYKRFGKYHNTSITTWNSISSIKITTLYVMFRLRKKTQKEQVGIFLMNSVLGYCQFQLVCGTIGNWKRLRKQWSTWRRKCWKNVSCTSREYCYTTNYTILKLAKYYKKKVQYRKPQGPSLPLPPPPSIPEYLISPLNTILE